MTQFAIKNQIRNVDNIPSVRCPTFFVHGQEDDLIDVSHSEQMLVRCRAPAEIIMPLTMSHNRFDFDTDLVAPFREFLMEHEIRLDARHIEESACFNFASTLFEPPAEILAKEKIQVNRISFISWFYRKFG